MNSQSDKTTNESINFSELSIGELEAYVNSNDDLNSINKFYARRELKLRELMSDINSSHSNTTSEKISKIYWYQRIDFKSILSISILFAFTIFMTFFTSYKKSGPPRNYNDYNLNTTGTVTSIKTNEMIIQGLIGSEVGAYNHIISFNYEINGIRYFSEMSIPAIKGNMSYIAFIKKNLYKNVFPIKYNSSVPKNSIVDLTMIND